MNEHITWPTILALLVGFAFANFVFQGLICHNYGKAAEITFHQAAAFFSMWLTLKLCNP